MADGDLYTSDKFSRILNQKCGWAIARCISMAFQRRKPRLLNPKTDTCEVRLPDGIILNCPPRIRTRIQKLYVHVSFFCGRVRLRATSAFASSVRRRSSSFIPSSSSSSNVCTYKTLVSSSRGRQLKAIIAHVRRTRGKSTLPRGNVLPLTGRHRRRPPPPQNRLPRPTLPP